MCLSVQCVFECLSQYVCMCLCACMCVCARVCMSVHVCACVIIKKTSVFLQCKQNSYSDCCFLFFIRIDFWYVLVPLFIVILLLIQYIMCSKLIFSLGA